MELSSFLNMTGYNEVLDLESMCKIIMFGDSIIKVCSPKLEKKLRFDYPEIEFSFVNEGISGETSRDGLARLAKLVDEKPDIVVIGFGMNDWRKGIGRREFKQNLIIMLDAFEGIGARVIITTLSPAYDFYNDKPYAQPDDYSEAVKAIAHEKKIKIGDVQALWKRDFSSPEKGLRDDIHPNKQGYAVICKALMWVVPRKYTTVLWQYNGREAKCNYRCPYCYYIGLHSSSDMFVGSIEKWHDSFRRNFGNQNLIFYLAFGEPTCGKNFNEIVGMIDAEKKWQLRITSNLSFTLQEIVSSTSVLEGRFNINASFHPCMIGREDFLKKILFLRANGIEASIVYVAYPPYFSRFEDDIRFFRDHAFVVHVRRFQGKYNGRKYPFAYTPAELKRIAKYSDDGMIKYMLNQQNCEGEPTYAGLHFFIIDNEGNAGYDSNTFRAGTKERGILGNLHDNTFKPNFLPSSYPGTRVGTVDGVANMVSYGYKELEKNNVLSFAKQGGVYKDTDGAIIYGNEFKDFDDPALRAIYNFSPLCFRERVLFGVKKIFKGYLKNKIAC